MYIKEGIFMLRIVIILSVLLVPLNVKANIMCNDGEPSPTCQDCHQGCCSHHGGCKTNYDYQNYNNYEYSDYSNDDNEEEYEYDDEEYEDDEEDDEEEYDEKSLLVFSGLYGMASIGTVGYAIAKSKHKI